VWHLIERPRQPASARAGFDQQTRLDHAAVVRVRRVPLCGTAASLPHIAGAEHGEAVYRV
jgi:hypothetical protein